MKRLNLIALFAFAFTLPLARANVPTPAESVQLSVDAVHVPAGFGDGTAQAVTIEVPLRDSCYHYDKIERQDLSTTEHQFKVFGHLDHQGMCMMVFHYVQRDVILSHLQPGAHDLIFVNADGSSVKQQINITKPQ